jgi:hypothetical protein
MKQQLPSITIVFLALARFSIGVRGHFLQQVNQVNDFWFNRCICDYSPSLYGPRWRQGSLDRGGILPTCGGRVRGIGNRPAGVGAWVGGGKCSKSTFEQPSKPYNMSFENATNSRLKTTE